MLFKKEFIPAGTPSSFLQDADAWVTKYRISYSADRVRSLASSAEETNSMHRLPIRHETFHTCI